TDPMGCAGVVGSSRYQLLQRRNRHNGGRHNDDGGRAEAGPISPAEPSPAGLPSPAEASPLEATPPEASPSHASPGSPGRPSAQALSQLISSPAWQTGSPPLEGGSAHVHRLTPYSISVSLSPASRVELSLTSPLRNRSEVSSSSVHPSCRCGRN